MVGVFFCCHNLVMDTVKLFDLLFDSEELKDIPQEYIFRVAYEFLVIIASGECFYEMGEML